ncbi:bestrophin family protein [Flavobacterium sp. FlaQc-47]|uniref:bestrophin family protein n=1 Tax=Flavobacterium sp. FlaQc-47 TaxID=3374180 RepID=UPI003756ED95
MYVNKNFSFKTLVKFTGWYLLAIVFWMAFIFFIYRFLDIKFIAIPWASVGIIGTAVSFYIGFKNYEAYERMWEARKIWGAILNVSRMWGAGLRGYIKNQFSDQLLSNEEQNAIIKKLIYRHISYVYTLRDQLLVPMPWEHLSSQSFITYFNNKRLKKFGIDMLEDDLLQEVFKKYLPKEEYEDLKRYSNMATHIIDLQSQSLMQIRKDNLISDLYHIELQKLLNELYSEQGKAERIKKFPLPRPYAYVSVVFVLIFITVLPLGLIKEFDRLGDNGSWLFIPVVSIIAWIFLLMELVGDYSENPFEGLGNDIPMFSLCRSIEIDLKEMIDDEDIPQPIAVRNGVLM